MGGLASRWGSANLERGGKEKPAHGSGKQGWTQPHVKQLCLYFQNWRDLKVTSLCRGEILRLRPIQASPTDIAQARREASWPTERHKVLDEHEFTKECQELSAREGHRGWPRLPK